MDKFERLKTANEIVAQILNQSIHCKNIVFISGNFNIIHPGHLRLFNFAAECGDFLVVGVNDDLKSDSIFPAETRLEGVSAIGIVDFALLLPVYAEEFISILRPNIVVKGKEYELIFNPEQKIVNEYGGKIIYSSGEVRFSSLDLINREILSEHAGSIYKPFDYLSRHQIKVEQASRIVQRFTDKKVLVIGDLILDEYITCEAIGMSQEDPTLVVSPIKKDMFIGGAGIVAAHASALGAKVSYFGISGDDEIASFALKKLKEDGVTTHLIRDSTRPTTLKQRYRAQSKTLLRVSYLRKHNISSELIKLLFRQILLALDETDLVVFSDFSYGCLPQELINMIIEQCQKKGIAMVADSQSSSQMGDIRRFNGMMLITPTEYEARTAMRDDTSGLVVLANNLKKETMSKHLLITMGSEGVFVNGDNDGVHGSNTDQLSALNQSPKDVSGAGDCLLITASLALVSGADIWQSAYLGSVAAACQVGRLGNMPLKSSELLSELER